MTSLHYTLIAFGVVLVAVVMLYNLWQERRSRKQAERMFEASEPVTEVSLDDLPLHEDLPETRIEPEIGLLDDAALSQIGEEVEYPFADIGVVPAPVSATAAKPAPVEAEPAVAPVPAALARPAPEVPAPERAAIESPLDGEIEYVVRLRYTQPTAIQFAPLQESLRRISKPIRMVGRREEGAWEPILGHGARAYDTVEMALLLADRAGPVSEVQIDSFCQRLYEFTRQHGGALSCPDKDAAIARAQALDMFCAEVDMLIGLNVIPADAGFAHQAVNDFVAQLGLAQGVDGSWSLRDGDGRLLFILNGGGQDDAGQGLSLLLDVPRVAQGLAAFDRMTELGQQLAEGLGGRLVDDGGRPVSRVSLDRDRKSLEAIYARMAERGVPAGGERALRLFA